MSPANPDGALGCITRVNGPLVEVAELRAVSVSDIVQLGNSRLAGEVVAIHGQEATVQCFEYTGGLRPGEPARSLRQPLSARLGPGLLGGIYDGLLRPLTAAPTWLAPTAAYDGGGAAWWFTPAADMGTELAPGAVLGTVPGPPRLEHRVLVPPGVSGKLDRLAPSGNYADTEPIAVVGGQPVSLVTHWPLRRPRPFAARRVVTEPLLTGQRVLDALFPVARGSCAAVPGGFGTGKTILLQQVAKWCDADVIVYVGCGERGNEMADMLQELRELEDPRRGGRLVDRTVIIANTSNMPMMAREASIYTGVTVAEYYRDMGYDAVVIADSTSRWAEALREFASRSGELPVEEGYPANLASALAAFYERAGAVTTLGERRGSVTILGAVSPPGGDTTEPVTAHTERFVRCLWSLDRDLAYARHYPAVSWRGSFSRDVDALSMWYAHSGDPDWARRRAEAVALLAESDRLAALADLVGVSALPGRERVVLLGGHLLREAVLQQNAQSPNDSYCPAEKAAALLDLVLDVVRGCHERVDRGVAAADLERLDFSAVLRARDELGPTEAARVRARRDAVLAEADRLP